MDGSSVGGSLLIGSEYISRTGHIKPVKRGQLVTYVWPFAHKVKGLCKTLEFGDRLEGIVLSGDFYNEVNDRPCICPILEGDSPDNQTLGIRIPSSALGESRYLRPDLATFISIDYGQIMAVAPIEGELKKRVMYCTELVDAACMRFIDTIQPTVERLIQRGRGFLPYGQIGWSGYFPRANEARTDRVPFINLTPSNIYETTGISLCARYYTNVGRNEGPLHVVVKKRKWLRAGFFSITDIVAAPIQGLLKSGVGYDPIIPEPSVLKGFREKVRGIFFEAAQQVVNERYGKQKGHDNPYLNSTHGRLLTPVR